MRDGAFEGFRLSPQQRRLWSFQMEGGSTLAQAAIRIEGKLDLSALRNAIERIARQHEILRTTYQHLPGMTFPYQVIGEEPAFEYRELNLLDLEIGSIARFHLVRESEEQYRLDIELSGMAADEPSLRILADAIALAYGGDLPDAGEAQYADYSEWQNELQEEGAGDRRTSWPAGRQLATGTDGFAPGWTDLRLQPDELAAAEALGRRLGCSLPALLLGCWVVLFWRLVRSTEMTVGWLVDGRRIEPLRGALGLCARYLPVHAVLRRGFRLEDLARTLDIAMEKGAARQEHFFPPEAETGLLFPLLFAFADLPGPRTTGDVRFSLEWHRACHEPFELHLSAVRSPRGLDLELGYDTRLWRDADAALLLGRYERLLSAVLADPGTFLEQLEILAPMERQQIQGWSRGPVVPVPDLPVHRLFEARVKSTPDAVALVGDGKVLTYAEVNRRANHMARLLLRRGVRAGSRVVLALERSVDQFLALLATLKAGGAFVPVDPWQPRERLARMLEDLERSGPAPVLLTRNWLLPRLPERGTAVMEWDGETSALAGEDDDNLDVPASSEDLAYIVFTSGSTGRPKGVLIRHRSMVNLAEALERRIYRDIPEQEPLRISLNAPLFFDAAIKQVVQWLRGRALYLLLDETRLDSRSLLEHAERDALDVLDCTPTQLRGLIAAGLLDPDRWAPRVLLVGGEPFDTDLWTTLAGQERIAVYNLYGPTECTVDATIEGIRASVSISVGRPLLNVEAFVLDEDLQLLPVGAPGELCLGGEGVAWGYAGQAAGTAERFVPHPLSTRPGERLYRTGDQAHWSAEGRLQLLGRLDRQVKLRGVRVELGEVEAALSEHPGVGRAVAAVGQGRLVAYVVPRLKPADSTSRRVYRLPNGLTVSHRNRHETDYLYEEIFARRAYLRHGIALPANACVLDVGANIGMFTLFVHQECASPRVFAFEPLPAIFESLRLNCERYGLAARLFPFGLADREKSEPFLYYPHYSMMSGQAREASPRSEVELVRTYLENQRRLGIAGAEQLLAEAEELLAGRFEGVETEVRLRPLSDILREERIEHVDLLKIDVQRAEIEVLRGIGDADWERIDQVVLEAHGSPTPGGGPRISGIRELLEKQGFSVVVEQDELLAGTDRYNLHAMRSERKRTGARGAGHETPAPLRPIDELTPQSLREWARRRLPDAMIPEALAILKELPLAPGGKVDLAALPNPETVETPVLRQISSPRTSMERTVAEVFAELLGIDEVGREENVFDLGLHSLRLIRAADTLRKRLDRPVQVTDLFRFPSVAALGRHLDGGGEELPAREDSDARAAARERLRERRRGEEPEA